MATQTLHANTDTPMGGLGGEAFNFARLCTRMRREGGRGGGFNDARRVEGIICVERGRPHVNCLRKFDKHCFKLPHICLMSYLGFDSRKYVVNVRKECLYYCPF